MDKKQILEKLEQFHGTENYYKSTFGKLKLTDGINWLRNELNCYWLIDIIESVQHLSKVKENRKFIVWKIEVYEDKSFKVTSWKDVPYESDLIYEQKGKYTDFPLKDFEFYQINDVLLLKGEY